jgi:hypothetical protein
MPMTRPSAARTLALLTSLAACTAAPEPDDPQPANAPAPASVEATPAPEPAPRGAAQPQPPTPPLARPQLDRAQWQGSWTSSVEPMPASTLHRGWLEVHAFLTWTDQRPRTDKQARAALDVSGSGPLYLIYLMWQDDAFIEYWAVLERPDGLLQLWFIEKVVVTDECGVAPKQPSHDPTLDGLPGVEVLSVAFASVDVKSTIERGLNPCAHAEPTWVDLLVDPVSNVSVMLTRHGRSDRPPDEISAHTRLRVEPDGVWVSGHDVEELLLIPLTTAQP